MFRSRLRPVMNRRAVAALIAIPTAATTITVPLDTGPGSSKRLMASVAMPRQRSEE